MEWAAGLGGEPGQDGLDAHAYVALQMARARAAPDPHGLEADEAAAVTLYTMESGLYPRLNRLLREKDRRSLRPYHPYLRLLLGARAKLPPFAGTVFRGVNGVDLSGQYPKGQEVCWWALSSATKTLDRIQQFIWGQGVCTIFHIEVHTAVDITEYSIFQEDEDEVRMPCSASLAVVLFWSPGGIQCGAYPVDGRGCTGLATSRGQGLQLSSAQLSSAQLSSAQLSPAQGPPAPSFFAPVTDPPQADGGRCGGFGTSPRYSVVCLSRWLLASRHCSFRPSGGPNVFWSCQRSPR